MYTIDIISREQLNCWYDIQKLFRRFKDFRRPVRLFCKEKRKLEQVRCIHATPLRHHISRRSRRCSKQYIRSTASTSDINSLANSCRVKMKLDIISLRVIFDNGLSLLTSKLGKRFRYLLLRLEDLVPG